MEHLQKNRGFFEKAAHFLPKNSSGLSIVARTATTRADRTEPKPKVNEPAVC